MIDLASLTDTERRNPTTDTEGGRRAKATGLQVDGSPDTLGIGLQLPHGRLTVPDCEVLIKYGRGVTVDLGTYKGRSAILLAQHADNVFTFDRYGSGEPEHSLKATRNNIRQYPTIQAAAMDSRQAAESFADQSVDVLFIDTDHNHKSVLADYVAWKDKLAPGARVLFHDYCLVWPEVVTAVNELLAGELREIETKGWIIITEQRHG